ncbi:hypothetical protein DFH09DRAFT_1092260 [Mycena vulgaris]|nr:hypothetical protein DFH09DRAFT_1092260 [Mycena vulgaris]
MSVAASRDARSTRPRTVRRNVFVAVRDSARVGNYPNLSPFCQPVSTGDRGSSIYGTGSSLSARWVAPAAYEIRPLLAHPQYWDFSSLSYQGPVAVWTAPPLYRLITSLLRRTRLFDSGLDRTSISVFFPLHGSIRHMGWSNYGVARACTSVRERSKLYDPGDARSTRAWAVEYDPCCFAFPTPCHQILMKLAVPYPPPFQPGYRLMRTRHHLTVLGVLQQGGSSTQDLSTLDHIAFVSSANRGFDRGNKIPIGSASKSRKTKTYSFCIHAARIERESGGSPFDSGSGHRVCLLLFVRKRRSGLLHDQTWGRGAYSTGWRAARTCEPYDSGNPVAGFPFDSGFGHSPRGGERG